MNKSIPMRAAAVLFVGVMLTSGIVSGSFAKYVTQDSQFDAARVAKFGVVATVTDSLFGDSYAKAEDNTVQAWGYNKETVSSAVKADDVVAPGTKSDEGMVISVTGTPEVSTKLTLENCKDGDKEIINTDIVLKAGSYGVMVAYTGEYTDDTVDNYYLYDADTKQFTQATAAAAAGKTVYELKDTAAAAADYKPLKWKVDNTECADVAAVKEAIAFTTTAADPNKDLATVYGAKTITWEWPFENASDDASDAKDTILGDMMADANDDNFIVVKANGQKYDAVSYASVDAAADAANKVTIAYVGSSASLDNACAVLTVTFGARLTITQVD